MLAPGDPATAEVSATSWLGLSERPSGTLRHLVKIRSPRCGFRGCRRAAVRCDDDHTIPYHMGGRTSGVLIWTTPSGRTYTVTPEPYPV